MRKKKITGIALLIIGFSFLLIKTGFSVIFIKPISKLTGFALLDKLQNVNSLYLNIGAFVLIVVGVILLLLKQKEVGIEVDNMQKKLEKLQGGK